MIGVLCGIGLVDFEQSAQILGKPDLALMIYSYCSMSSLLGLLLLYRFVLRYFSSSVKSGEWGNICVLVFLCNITSYMY
jgi:hypothetical protein